ncbi:hypothetical protein FRUB_04089 [Fimbriiglobus ruber]|uniref:Uncharacterized protein n=1 Tax=Fimbriiglobus ruber TaxID=1908690 RepID=A0A225DKP2_9BACT|nr:hypothetical protein FRUB_04089 [Fimbriiglobus ruber]
MDYAIDKAREMGLINFPSFEAKMAFAESLLNESIEKLTRVHDETGLTPEPSQMSVTIRPVEEMRPLYLGKDGKSDFKARETEPDMEFER